ncbi:hypothetical protein CERSUDRAFT_114899 [Gelatoporia subvermispora B]|uniref:Uncharacterized protein n=1 Tax=Ceriporiopsis subvermispora (strain B) TaxID=914234 RepID=M2RDW5_CERS8|nr:hypothetical protein CERSUDRAFT_114899 [Gelatoporia subvermispora B]
MPTPAPQTGRLRSKTSDISDLLRGHGGRSDRRNSESHQQPPSQQSEPTTPTKGKRKIPIFGRRRKSESVSPSLSTSDHRTPDEEVPPLPPLDSRVSTGDHVQAVQPPARFTSETSRIRPPSQVSIPPVSSLPKPQGRASYSQPPHEYQRPNASSVPVTRIQQLRAQKSTSFEYTRQSIDPKQGDQSSSGRPVITISAPPPISGPTSSAQRSIPSPQQPHTGRRFGLARFSSRRAEQPKASESPPLPAGPGSPTSAKQSSFADASADKSRRTSVAQEQSGDPSASHDPPRRQRTVSRVHSFLPSTRSPPHDKPRKSASALPLSKSRQDQSADATVAPVKRSISESSATPSPDAADSVAAARAALPPSRSRIPGSSSIRSLAARAPPPLLPTWRRPLSGGPPLDPLPSPPHSGKTIKGGDTDTKGASPSTTPTPTPTSTTFPALSSRPSMAWVHQQVFGQTIENIVPTAPTHSHALEAMRQLGEPPSPSAESQDRDRETVRFLIPEAAKIAEHDDHFPHDAATPEQLREALNSQSIRYARLAAHMQALMEKHAAEKNELTRRIETLEHEARKREQEIKGLRWLVVNTNSTPPASAGRQTGFFQAEHSQDLARLGPQPDLAPDASRAFGSGSGHGGSMSIDSLSAGSMEEGLLELQATVSDLIAPLSTSSSMEMPARQDTGPIPMRRRRSNTMPYELNQDPSVLAVQKLARRTSSPVLPPPSGTQSMFPLRGSPTTSPVFPMASLSSAGIDLGSIPTIPSLSSGAQISPVPSIISHSLSLPSLTATNTASSGLSAIPELPKLLADEGDAAGTDLEVPEPKIEKREVEPPPGSSPKKHVSAGSVSSIRTSSSHTNPRSGSSPSIGQVLDRATGPNTDFPSQSF